MTDPIDHRVLILAAGRDGDLTRDILARAGFICKLMDDAASLKHELSVGAGVLVCAEESLDEEVRQVLRLALEQQPPWSDLPILVVASPSDQGNRLEGLRLMRNISVLGRPMPIETLVTAVQSALRARVRQYEVRALLREREEASRRKDDFLAMLAHELRNPLAPVRYGVRVLHDACGSKNPTAAHAISLVDRQVAHMARLIDDLLDVSRISRGVVDMRLERVDLCQITKNVVESRVGNAIHKRLDLVLEKPPYPIWVNGDSLRLTQVIDNLIDNAEKFSQMGGRIEVGVNREGEDAVIFVEDRGEGIEEDVLAHLFEPFSQADRSLDRSKGGLGLGLAIVNGIVTLHGGNVTASSNGPGTGARFLIHLPCLKDPEPVALAKPSTTTAHGKNSLKVLVVEDNHDSAELLRMMLNLYGHTVEVAYSGPEGIEAARRFAPDVLLCDIGLPGMNGYAIAQTLTASSAIRPRRLVAVSGYGSPEHRRQSMKAGFDAHLVKPVSPEDLLKELRRTQNGSMEEVPSQRLRAE